MINTTTAPAADRSLTVFLGEEEIGLGCHMRLEASFMLFAFQNPSVLDIWNLSDQSKFLLMDGGEIEVLHGDDVLAYGEVIDIIRPIGEAESVFVPGELSGDEAKKTADELLSALDDFDDERSSELANKLTGYPFRITQKEKLKKAIDLIADFLYDEAADLIIDTDNKTPDEICNEIIRELGL